MTSNITRTFNFVGRKKINAGDVTIRTSLGDKYVEVEVGRVVLPDPDKRYEDWQNSRVILKARDKVSDAYFEREIGSVLEVQNRVGTVFHAEMAGFKDISGIKFSLRVIGPRKIVLASLDDFSADNDTPIDRDEIFQLQTRDLGEEIWILDWTSGNPILVMDTEFAEMHMNNPIAMAAILPPSFREILKTAAALAFENPEECEPWVQQFIDFAEVQVKAGPMPNGAEPGDAAMNGWVDAAVAKFSRQFKFKSSTLD